MTTKLQWISERWLNSLKATLPAVRKRLPVRVANYDRLDASGEPVWEDSGETEPNPAHEALVRRIEAAEYHFATKVRIVEKAAKAGYKPNSYEGRCETTGETVKAGAGFVRKDVGRWLTYSRDVVIESLGIQIVDLPELDA